MRKPHRPAAGTAFLRRKNALSLLLLLPILAFFLLLPPLRRTFSTNPSVTLPFSGDLRPPKLAYLISTTRGDVRRIKRLLKAVYHPWNYYLLQIDLRPPKLAYLISTTRGDVRRIKRLLKAVYHPWNYYLLQIDLTVSPEERRDLTEFAGSEPAFLEFGNVRVVENAEVVTAKGPTMMSSALHAAAVLLRDVKDWSWFINLDAADYPLVSQDDLLHILSFLPKDLNFVEHTSNIGWKEHQRARPIIVDPGLYGSDKTDVFWVKDKRSLPSSFKLFVGSSCVILSWSFLEFCILGWDNLPRTLLMYYTNFLTSSEGYFHTVICNSMDFQNTTVNHDLRFTMWDDQPHQSPMNLTLEHFSLMVDSGAPFARTFVEDSPVLDQIDMELLKKSRSQFTPGGWCLGSSKARKDPCAVFGKANIIRPTAGSRRLEGLLLKLLDAENFRPRQCK